MLLIQLVAAFAITQAPAPANPQAAPATTAQAGPVSPATAASLARTVAPAEIMIPLELEQARKAILALPTLDQEAKELEAEFPGLYAALWNAVEPEMQRSIEAEFPSYWAELERLYVARLSEREAQAVLSFFQSATGQKLIRNMYGSVDVAPMLADMVKSDSWQVSSKQMEAVTNAAKAKAVKQIGPADEADLWILAASIDMKKFKALGAETQKITLEWVNREDPKGEEALTKIMQDAMERYMADHPSKP